MRQSQFRGKQKITQILGYIICPKLEYPFSVLTSQTHHQPKLLSLNISEERIQEFLRNRYLHQKVNVVLNENTHSKRGIVIGHKNQRSVPNPSGNSVRRGRRRHNYRSFAPILSSEVCFGGRRVRD